MPDGECLENCQGSIMGVERLDSVRNEEGLAGYISDYEKYKDTHLRLRLDRCESGEGGLGGVDHLLHIRAGRGSQSLPGHLLLVSLGPAGVHLDQISRDCDGEIKIILNKAAWHMLVVNIKCLPLLDFFNEQRTRCRLRLTNKVKISNLKRTRILFEI